MITKAAFLVPALGALAFLPAVLLARQSQVHLVAFTRGEMRRITLPSAEPTVAPGNVVQLEDTVVIGTRPRRAKTAPHPAPMPSCGPPRQLLAGSGTVRPCEQ